MRPSTGMDRARLALERGDRLPAATLPPLVAQSWLRCRDAGLDPREAPREGSVEAADLRRRRDALAGLRRAALAEMKLLFAQIAGSEVLIALGDRDGVVLDTLSDRRFVDTPAGRAIVPGSIWIESLRGTNALGLAAREGAAVAIWGREHYFACDGRLSCMAAPILDPDGGVLGVLDASCDNAARQQHTHALVRMGATRIENSLIFQERADCHILAFHPQAEYLDTASAGLVAVTREGEVTALNRLGRSLLAGLPTDRGVAFDMLFEDGFGRTMSALLAGGIVSIRDRAGSAVSMVCRQIGQGRPAITARGPLVPPRIEDAATAPDFVCGDPALRRSMRGLPRALAMGMPIHVAGETGTGKELMARHVHRISGRKGEFVAVNCGALPENLLIAELFGHERGAYTGARADGAPGLAVGAEGGTLFLDEVAEIPLAAQAALLRFLDTSEVRSVGARGSRRVDVRIVSATNQDLAGLVADRAFRADLLYRLEGFTLRLPALRERADFAEVVRGVLRAVDPAVAITDAAIAALARRPWPGNIRELRSALQRALVVRDEVYLDETAFAGEGTSDPPTESCCERCRGHALAEKRCREIRSVHAETGENVTETARRLGLSRTTVYSHLEGRSG